MTDAESRVTLGRIRAIVQTGWFTFSDVDHAPGLFLATHCHIPLHMCYVRRGAFIEGFGGGETACGPGTLIVKGPQCEHWNRIGAYGARTLALCVNPSAELGLREFAPRGSFRTGESRRTTELAERMYQELSDSRTACPMVLEELAFDLLGALSGTARNAGTSRSPVWLRHAREILHEELSEFCGLTALAARVGIHPVHLARTFRASFGQTIGDYLRGERVRRARHMLAGTTHPIAEIAVLTGCSDQAHLTRLFRATTGWTPAAFRREFSRLVG